MDDNESRLKARIGALRSALLSVEQAPRVPEGVEQIAFDATAADDAAIWRDALADRLAAAAIATNAARDAREAAVLDAEIDAAVLFTKSERRDRIATACLAGLLAADSVGTNVAAHVDWAVRYADALIAALDAKPAVRHLPNGGAE